MPRTSKSSDSSNKRSVITPLGIIATFVTLSESIAGLAATQTVGSVQMIFTYFAVGFPLFVATAFFAILWKRPSVLYPPQEFGPEVNVKEYVDAMRHQALSNQEVLALVRTTISDSLSSHESQNLLSRFATNGQAAKTPVALQKASSELVEQAVVRLQKAVLTVDISAFRKAPASPELIFAYDAKEEAFMLLTSIYIHIIDQVPIYSYGKSWALQDSVSGNYLLPAGVDWEENRALAESGATVADLGLEAGMRVRAVPLHGKPMKVKTIN